MVGRRTSLLVLALGAFGLRGQNSGVVTGVDQLVQQAFERNREVLAAQERVAEARGVLRQGGVRPVPTVEANAASGRPLGTQGEEEYSLGYFHPIELGDKRSKRLLVAEQSLASAEAGSSERRRQLAYDIKTRYIDAIANQRKAEAIEAILKVNRESYNLVNARVQRGDAAPLERQLLAVEVNRTESQRAAAGGQMQAARLELRRAVGIDVDMVIAANAEISPPATLAASLGDLKRQAIEERPDLRAALALASQSAAEVELAQAQGRPDLTLSARYTRLKARS